MKSFLLFIVLILFQWSASAQGPYAPVAGVPGTKAMHMDSSAFVAWATNVEVTRGLMLISVVDSGYASYGSASDAIGAPDPYVVSLGDSGQAVATFEGFIKNEDGPDFAIFENSAWFDFLELAFVEVSSDGLNYFRFPAHSLSQTDTQIESFGPVDATNLYNLAGKYIAQYGTPFDLDDIADTTLLDKDKISHVKIIDVVGTLNPNYAAHDSYGNIVNDPFPTPWESSGFDLDAIGAIHFTTVGIPKYEWRDEVTIYPNPVRSRIKIQGAYLSVHLFNNFGEIINVNENENTLLMVDLTEGMYYLHIETARGLVVKKVIKI